MHDDWPPVEYVPDTHGLDAAEDVDAQAWPAGHTVHDDCPPIENVPASHVKVMLEDVDAHA